MVSFKTFSREQATSHTNVRAGELKLGNRIWVPEENQNLEAALASLSSNALVIGIPEDIGVRANGGIGGATSLWPSFLKAFLNTQVNSATENFDIGLLGAFEVEMDEEETQPLNTLQLSAEVEKLDEEVGRVMQKVFGSSALPIIIGGGHNNAYPLLKALSRQQYGPVNCVNVDAHADLRETTNRHSGNGFSYALEEGFLQRYFVLGLQEAYNNEHILSLFEKNKNLAFISHYDITVAEKISISDATAQAITFTNGLPYGLEIDLDAVAGVLSSAATPCGFSISELRKILRHMLLLRKPAYIHICEGATTMQDGRTDNLTGKLVAQLVLDIASALSTNLKDSV